MAKAFTQDGRLVVESSDITVVTPRDQAAEWAARKAASYRNPGMVDTSMFFEDMPEEEYRSRFPGSIDLTVVTPCGEIWIYTAKRLTQKSAKTLQQRIEARGSIDAKCFRHLRTMYGSEAYIRNGVEEQVVEMEEMERRGLVPEGYVEENILFAK